jgi:glutamine---fructose-6-phosphate transaminase (isomerizing)
MEKTKQTPRWISGIEPPQELLSATGAQILEVECRAQPARLHELIQAYGSDSGIRNELKKFRDLPANEGPVLFIGMGASFCSSIGGSIFLQSQGRLSFSVDAGEWLHYASAAWGDATLSVLLTTSGESAELVELFRIGCGKALGLICNNPASTCWNLALIRLPILAGPEYGNATKTYTNATAAVIILASEMVGRTWMEDAERAAAVFATHLEPIFCHSERSRELLPGCCEHRDYWPRRGLRQRHHKCTVYS